MRPAKEIRTALRAAYGKALELDSYQVDALAAKGFDLVHSFDFQTVTEVFSTAVAHELEQDVLVDFGLHLLVAQRREEELLKIGSEAERRDPLSASTKAAVGIALTWLRRFGEAVAKLQEGLILEPQHIFLLLELGRNCIHLGRFVDAQEAIKSARRVAGPGGAFGLYMQGFWHVAQGQQAAANAALDRMKTLYQADASPSDYTYHIGALSLDLREIEEGMTWLERACDENHWFMPIVHVQFAGDEEVIGHPRFQALLKRMHLDAESLKRLQSTSGKRERTTGPGQERTTGQELSRPGRAR